MSNRLLLLQLDPLIACWREADLALCQRSAVSESKSRAKGTETIGAGAEEIAVLWRKASKSEILSCLRKAASEIMHRGTMALAAIVEMYGMAKASLMWSEHWIPSEPHQELIPWVGLFRTVAARNPLWVYTWPEEEYLHP
ncbi:MAG: hypothetical protein WC521_06895 [Bdellovibrionales bacterium]|jgi:hypothetical protein